MDDDDVMHEALRAGRTVICLAPRKSPAIRGLLKKEGVQLEEEEEAKAGTEDGEGERIVVLAGSTICGPETAKLPSDLSPLVARWKGEQILGLSRDTDTYSVKEDILVGPLRRACKIVQGNANGNAIGGCRVASWEGTMTNNLGASVQMKLDSLRLRDVNDLKEELRRAFGQPRHMNPMQLLTKDRGILLGNPLAFTHRLNELERDGEEFRIEFQDTRSPFTRVKECLAGFEKWSEWSYRSKLW